MAAADAQIVAAVVVLAEDSSRATAELFEAMESARVAYKVADAAADREVAETIGPEPCMEEFPTAWDEYQDRYEDVRDSHRCQELMTARLAAEQAFVDARLPEIKAALERHGVGDPDGAIATLQGLVGRGLYGRALKLCRHRYREVADYLLTGELPR